MMDCKRALTENGGDIEAAVDWLRKKGLAAAAKKAGRVAAEGLIGVAADGTAGAMVEVNSETDFVARNDAFQEYVRNVTKAAISSGEDVEKLKTASYAGGGTVADALTALIAKIGENMSLRRASVLKVSAGAVATYVHSAAAPASARSACSWHWRARAIATR